MSIAGAVPVATLSGAQLFARYAYPPNALGYCGPADSAALFGYGTTGEEPGALRRLCAQFEGAWPYLELIAACNGISDPLDHRVVHAYWLGSDLLAGVPVTTFVSSLDERFSRQAGGEFAAVATSAVALAPSVRAHHGFHVFGVYPWVGLLRRGMEGPALQVLDRCRIRWGEVVAVGAGTLVVRSRALVMAGSRLVLGDAVLEEVHSGRSAPQAVGDRVSMHWDWVCDRISPGEARRLERDTRRILAVVNSAARPGPAVACDRLG